MDRQEEQKRQLEEQSDPSPRPADKLRQELKTKSEQLEIHARQLSEILKINEVLRLDLTLEDLLQKVASAVQRSLGFKQVLISLYDRDRHRPGHDPDRLRHPPSRRREDRSPGLRHHSPRQQGAG